MKDGGALKRLLDYIDEEQARRCRHILDKAEKEAAAIVGVARRQARTRMSNFVDAEKRRRNREVELARANVQSRLRHGWYDLIRRELDQVWPLVRQRLIDHWRASETNRRQWLSVTLETATHALGPGLWHVEHPGDWAMYEGAAVFRDLKREYEMLEVHFEPTSEPAGFRVICSDVCVSTTVQGLLAQRSRVEGLWLARMYASDALRLPPVKAT
ncbi:MAG: hypothetical protein HUJ31_15030 [Pseudomonadales bacterium]|nr:hypothetical protein [Pseudomonadales bacterium]